MRLRFYLKHKPSLRYWFAVFYLLQWWVHQYISTVICFPILRRFVKCSHNRTPRGSQHLLLGNRRFPISGWVMFRTLSFPLQKAFAFSTLSMPPLQSRKTLRDLTVMPALLCIRRNGDLSTFHILDHNEYLRWSLYTGDTTVPRRHVIDPQPDHSV